MKSYNIIGHVADLRLKVEASSLEELLAVALEGMNEILKSDFCKQERQPSETHQIEIKSLDKTSLLVDFLSEALSFSHIDSAIFCRVKFVSIGTNSLVANLSGAKVSGFDEDVKAVSYHEAEIVRNSQGNFETNLVFDI